MNESIGWAAVAVVVVVAGGVFCRSDPVFFDDDVVSMCNMSRPLQFLFYIESTIESERDVLPRFFAQIFNLKKITNCHLCDDCISSLLMCSIIYLSWIVNWIIANEIVDMLSSREHSISQSQACTYFIDWIKYVFQLIVLKYRQQIKLKMCISLPLLLSVFCFRLHMCFPSFLLLLLFCYTLFILQCLKFPFK